MCRPRLHGLIRSNFRLGVRGKRFVIGVDGRNGTTHLGLYQASNCETVVSYGERNNGKPRTPEYRRYTNEPGSWHRYSRALRDTR